MKGTMGCDHGFVGTIVRKDDDELWYCLNCWDKRHHITILPIIGIVGEKK